ncbi:MAG: tyrosine-type recombinase/integrase [Terriglobales bacterium]
MSLPQASAMDLGGKAIPSVGKDPVLGRKGQYLFWSGESTRKSATSVYDKLYRKIFEKARIVGGGSHRFRHLFAVSLLEAGVDLRVV